MVETVTESISKTKDEWIQQFLLDKARNDYNCYAAAHREPTEKPNTFFFKQKTAYEILTCDWSSDVCSSDLW